MSLNDITLHLDPNREHHLSVNGQDITHQVRAQGVTVGWVNDSLPRVTLDLLLTPRITVDGKAEVDVHPDTATLLEALGWTPPSRPTVAKDRPEES